MLSRTYLTSVYLFSWSLCLLPVALSYGDTERPNVIVIMADDLGWADIGMQQEAASRDVLTPNIDRLFEEGLRFTNGYVASSTCGPSRASFLTGRTSSRFGLEDNVEQAPPTSEVFLPAAIKNTGYKSSLVGKWHLGYEPEEQPLARLDFFYGFLGGGHDYWEGSLMRGTEYEPFDGYMTDVLADEAAQFIGENKEEPFFLYVAFNAPHSPMQAPQRLIERAVAHQPDFEPAFERMKLKEGEDGLPRFDHRPFKGPDVDAGIMRLVYCAMVIGLDDGVGQILQAVEDANIRENTLIVFLSDNGAALARPNDFGESICPCVGKGTIFDGGLRVVFGASCRIVLAEGEEYHGIINAVDLFTTTVELAGGEIPNDRIIDGVNLMPYLTGEKEEILTKPSSLGAKFAVHTRSDQVILSGWLTVRTGQVWESSMDFGRHF